MTQHETWPIWAVSVGVVVPLVAVIAFCVCGCKKTVPKNELLGLAGMVKITNPEESLNHNHQSNESNTCNAVSSGNTCVDSNRRSSSTVNRSLPAIPNDPERIHLEGGDPIWEEANGDTSSELYATVEDNKHVIQPLMQGHGMPGALKRVSALNSQLDESKNSSTDDGLNLYACVKAEHPYDRLKKSEHPYAQVKTSSHVPGDALFSEPGPSHASLRVDEVSNTCASGSSSETASNNGNPIPPPRTRKSNSHTSLLAASTQLPDPVSDIPAATAIAGHISANQELPYMTPPIHNSGNFSGDSQDSKGYTSISVREPLANIKAQTKASNQRSRAQELVDSHYATVSDDSDEMYAAIEDPTQVYTSGSETYAQIQPTSVPEPQPVPSTEPYYPPQPPSVDSLKHVAQAHSRQASSSSATSSVANLGSPKPEKRQANSPLPPPPAGSPELHSVDKKCLLHPGDAATSLNLDEMYAKVLKKKERNIESEPVDDVLNNGTADSISQASVEHGEPVTVRTKREPDKVSVCSNSEIAQDLKMDSSSYDTSPIQSNEDLYRGYEKLYNSDTQPSRDCLTSESDYESVTTHIVKYDPGYEVVQRQRPGEPNYEELRPQTITVSDDAKINNASLGKQEKCSSAVSRTLSNSDPGYEKVHASRTLSNSDPGYEKVHASRTLSNSDPGYEKVNTNITVTDKNRDGDDTGEPNYESMPSEGPEHSYAGILGAGGGNDSDPNYEMVEHEDPNYESVNYFEVNSDPPYERLQNDDTIPGYEQVKQQGSDSTLGYETVDKKPTENTSKRKRCNEPGYEEVGKKNEGSGIDVWQGNEHSIRNSNSHTVKVSKQNSGDLLNSSISEQTDLTYAQVQKNIFKL